VNLASLPLSLALMPCLKVTSERPERGRYFLVRRLTATLWRYILSCYDALILRFLFLQSYEVPLRGKIECLEALQHRALDMSR
jgi:hypothetical protein